MEKPNFTILLETVVDILIPCFLFFSFSGSQLQFEFRALHDSERSLPARSRRHDLPMLLVPTGEGAADARPFAVRQPHRNYDTDDQKCGHDWGVDRSTAPWFCDGVVWWKLREDEQHDNIHFQTFSPLVHKTSNISGEAYSSKATFPQFERLFLERLYVLVACQDRITLNLLDRSFSGRGYSFKFPRDQTVYFLTFLLFVNKKWTKWSQNA